MSVITIVKKGGLVAMAADTQTSSCSRKFTAQMKVGSSKIMRFGDSLLGFVGYSAHGIVFGDLIRKHAGALDFAGRTAIFETAFRVHEILKENYHLRTSEGDSDQPYDSSQLMFAVANPYGIFVVESYREVFEYAEYNAIGSGASYALGARHALYHQDGSNAEFVAREGAITSATFDIYCGEPVESFAVETTAEECRR